jgi:hypothetical protein
MSHVTLLDGGIGHLLKAKGVERLVSDLKYEDLFVGGALANDLAPEPVAEGHREYIAAGERQQECVSPYLCSLLARLLALDDGDAYRIPAGMVKA